MPSPKPRGIFHPALKIGYSFIETALAHRQSPAALIKTAQHTINK
jgi:hypothetical protein